MEIWNGVERVKNRDDKKEGATDCNIMDEKR